MTEQKRSPGRPRKTEDGEPIKRGKKTWKPAQKLDIRNKKEGFRYRMVDKDQMNIQKKLAEGWSFANKERGTAADHVKPENIGDGQELGSVTEYRELVLMILPEEDGKARDEYIEERTNQQTVGVKKNLQDDADKSASEHGGYKTPIHGKVIIE